MSMPLGPVVLEIPDPDEGEKNPGSIEPGEYNVMDLVELLRNHKNNPEAIQFIADMMEV